LADPNGVAEEGVVSCVDGLLGALCMRLLSEGQGSESADEIVKGAKEKAEEVRVGAK